MAAPAPSSTDLAQRTASEVVAIDAAQYEQLQKELLDELNSTEAAEVQNAFFDMIIQMGEKLGPRSLMDVFMDGELDATMLRSLIPDSVNERIAAANPDISEPEREKNLLSMLSTIARGVEMSKQGIQKAANGPNDLAQGPKRTQTMREGDTLEDIFSKGPTDPNASPDALSSALRGMSLDGPGVPPEMIKHFQEMMKNPLPAPVAGVQIADAEDAKARVAQFKSSVKDFIAALRADSGSTQKLQHAMNGVIVRPLIFGTYQKEAAEAISEASKGIDKIIEGMAHVLAVKQMPTQLPALRVLFSAEMLKPLEDQAPPTAYELEEVLTETIPKINEVIDKFAASEAAARTKAEERAQALLTEELD